ncbi:MAG: PaaI family thioesterase [Deltaproteobacteria bacterium]|nr:PaaI family thioesterase [Deltaproteobacteria bacterium]
MSRDVIERISRQVEKEPYAGKLGLRLIELEPGHAVVEMAPQDDVGNILGMIHGGAIFSLIDEAFQVSCNAYGTVAVALSMTLTYHSPPGPEATLRAESTEIHRSRRTGSYSIRVTDDRGTLIASCQALAYRKQQPLPFLSGGEELQDGARSAAGSKEGAEGGSAG